MDNVWAQRKLEQYLGVCDQIKTRQEAAGGWDDYCSALNEEAEQQLPTVEKIVRAAYPPAPQPLMSPNYPSHDSVRWALRAIGALRDESDVAVRLRPDSPVIPADHLHPRIWDAAAPVWDTGEFGAALQQASITLSAYIRAKATSSLRDRKLVDQVFAPGLPKVGTPRLHFPGDPADEAWQARQQGLHLMAQGAFAGIRNIVAHEDGDWSEQEALELLAVLSTIARWVDCTELRVAADQAAD